MLASQLESAAAEAAAKRASTDIEIEDSIEGSYIAFKSGPGLELALASLDPRYRGLQPELRGVHWVPTTTEGQLAQEATVFVPEGKISYFLQRLHEYAETATDDVVRHRRLVDSIEEISAATVRHLWTDRPSDFPVTSDAVWWEVWLRRRDGHEAERLQSFAYQVEATVASESLLFEEYSIVVLKATVQQLGTALQVLDDISELRRPRETADALHFESPADQAEWVSQLEERLVGPQPGSPAVCVLDTGVHVEHPLLRLAVRPDGAHAVNSSWGTGDHEGHGTEMAGLSLYGDLLEALGSSGTVEISHQIESVKILPPTGTNDPALYGAITAHAAGIIETAAPGEPRLFSMSVSAARDPDASAAQEPQTGQPSSWSAAVDALSVGQTIDSRTDGVTELSRGAENEQRLFIVSTGNIQPIQDTDHVARSQVEPVEDPAQAWNALTVGAYTDRDDLSSMASYANWEPVASRGELSPTSRTSVLFNSAWPPKPEIVMEGGNAAVSPSGDFDEPEPMQLLTTAAPLGGGSRTLTLTNATSAATAQAARLGALIMTHYPSLWPETVRALIVHSAEWTEPMRARFESASKSDRYPLLRTYGMGVPSADRALNSATDALVLIAQDELLPFTPDRKLNEMHIHDLPWPTIALEDLGETSVRLRVTLSYFVEPNPARRGWDSRYSYQSHGLRFELMRPTESRDQFRQRVNAQARADDYQSMSSSDAAEWFLPASSKTAGSLHTDIWHGSAAKLAARGAIAITPTTGWWKHRSDTRYRMTPARYGLVVSIETPGVEADIWTPVAQQIQIPVEIPTNI